MKLITIFGAGLLAFSGSFALSNNIFATESTGETASAEILESTKPTQAELRSAIARIESLEVYQEYSLLSNSEIEAAEFYREYVYLSKVINAAKALDANYDNASAEDLIDIVAAATDAATACGLIFNSAHQTSTSTTSPTQTPTVSAPKPTVSPAITTTNRTPAPATSTASTVTVTVVADDTSSDSSINNLESPIANPDKTTPENPAADDIAVPATGAAKSNKPLFITLGVVALACLLVGSMIILNRKKSYHPGRKF